METTDSATLLKQHGFTQILGLWIKQEDGKVLFSTNLRPGMQDRSIWRSALQTVARAIAVALTDLSPRSEEADLEACRLLRETSQDMMVFPMLEKIDELADEEEREMTVRDIIMHPGEIELPPQVSEINGAKQLFSVWSYPDHKCSDCGDIHESGYFLGQETAENKIQNSVLGKMLAEFARHHVDEAVNPAVALFEIQGAFNTELSKEMAHA